MAGAASQAVDWERIDTVLVDMDGTLLDLAFDNLFWLETVPERYAELNGLELHAARAWVNSRSAEIAGTLPWYCLDHWSRDLRMDVRALKHSQRHLIRFLPGAPEFLASVRARRKELLLVTNAHRETFAVKAKQTGIDRLVDAVVCSHDLRAPKETAEFWHALQRHRPFDVARSLLIEDSVAVLAAARAYGVRHTLAIRRPDSRLPARSITEFPAIDGVLDLV